MDNMVNVIQKPDDSVKKLIAKGKKLNNKYTKKRKVNEKLLKKRTPLQKAISITFDVICVLLMLFAIVLCFSTINSRLQGYIPTFAGYSNMRVQTGSMVASGHKVGDTIIVHTVDTHTLHVGDKIAFYVYSPDYMQYDVNIVQAVADDTIPANKYTFNISNFVGMGVSASQKSAAKAGASVVFHHIIEIYEDASGVRWFKTKGSSNESADGWMVSERMVVGLYDGSGFARFMSRVISAITSRFGVLLLLIPAGALGAVILMEFFRDVQLARLELDCVEEKRKINDPICVKNNVGFNMSAKTKYKILAQATAENRNEYISLLWRDGSVPDNVRKYYMRKDVLLSYNRKMLQLNRVCEQMFKDNFSATKIAKYYNQEKEKILAEQRALAMEFRKKTS